MKQGFFIRFIHFITLSLVIYCIYFIILHFVSLNIGDLTIDVSAIPSQPESHTVSITTTKASPKYYLLIYEENEDNWLYFNSFTGNADSSLTDLFLPNPEPTYLFFEGNKTQSSFHFKLTSKYPLNYMASQEHIFHVDYIVPFQVFPFPPFYYSKHYTFFINPLI
ncbi:MAG: hypothetical protein ACRCWY_09595 [Cellulosilyticaceae bacterium]